LGADAKVNGGSGKTVQVLLDTGATGDWVIWAGCTESVCTSTLYFPCALPSLASHGFHGAGGHNVYNPSKQHFQNLSIHESLAYGDGGPANTISMWRVNDTVAFGNVSIPSTPFGAADSLPSSGEGLDGNFGMARGRLLCIFRKLMTDTYLQHIVAGFCAVVILGLWRRCMRVGLSRPLCCRSIR
jgi:Eukaryotic aspartyl protease